jgi:transcriptional regulator with XRE-family HTH domain
MGRNSKALLVFGKALIPGQGQADNKAMLSTAETIKKKMAEVLSAGLKQIDIASHCGVSKQAVQSWKNTGRIDKRHLPLLAEVSRRPLSWWLDIGDDATEAPGQAPGRQAAVVAEKTATYNHQWPFRKIGPHEYATLNDHQRSLVEAYVRGLIDESYRNKRDGESYAA